MPAATDSPAATIDEIVGRCAALYSLPAVAVEVLRLTDHPKVDVPALKSCLECDPALTAKLLRVVNSSLFGLPREVSDLNQALSLLGIKPLKLLVLGFSLPENLFLGVAREQLTWYWNGTLARAVAAREISEQLFGRPGDDAFLAGLLKDIGLLVLLRELGGPYAALVSEAAASQQDLHDLERETLGFDHAQLTARLLELWNMPTSLVKVVREPRDHRLWANNHASHAPLVRTLHLAELFAQLVGQHRLTVLPDLLEAGEAYCQLDRQRLNELVAGLEPKVRQLAKVMSLDVVSADRYGEIIAEAHDRMAALAESAAAPLSAVSRLDDRPQADAPAEAALALAHDLQAAVDRFLRRPSAAAAASAVRADVPAARASESLSWPQAAGPLVFDGPRRDEFDVRLKLAVGHCRASRVPLSVVALGAAANGSAATAQAIEKALDAVLEGAELGSESVERPAAAQRIVIQLDCDRSDAVALGRRLVEHLRELLDELRVQGQLARPRAAAGVATVGVPAKNFQAARLLETAERCLAAALGPGGVKSLEVS